MVFIDYFLAFIILISLFFGFYRGFIRELLALIGLVIAFYCANKYSDLFISYVPFGFDDSINKIITYLVIFILVLIISALIIKLINKFIKSAGLSFINIFMGGFFGFIRGLLISILIIYLAEKSEFSLSESWYTSSVVLLLKETMEKTLPYLPFDWRINVKYDSMLS
ncbi:CvpA family protein [Methylophilaceae bacterium]|jgi:membrane protein required for colicin V production|nr:CvpA family protein [Methylophilaceae bacterium]|tara:strand:+ start:6693 stop:7193 length:501 start_codon:yes stop_codon:yes gene_type:complete